MTKLISSAVVAFALCGCASTPYGWKLDTEGCFKRSLHEALYVPEAAELGPTDVRVGRWVSESDVRVLQFIRGLDEEGVGESQKRLLIGMGNAENSCIAIVPSSACPGVDDAYNRLAKIAFPVGYRFDQRNRTEVVDGTIYFLASKDGEGNTLNWSGSGLVHPASEEIDIAFQTLESCFAKTSLQSNA